MKNQYMPTSLRKIIFIVLNGDPLTFTEYLIYVSYDSEEVHSFTAKRHENKYLKHSSSSGRVAQLVGAPSHTLKGHRINSQSGCIQEATNPCVFLPRSLSPFSEINGHILR